MSIQTPGETTLTPIETRLTDRQILLHLLAHVEDLAAMLEPFRPVLQAAAPGGRPDAISLAQAGRMLRGKGARRGRD
jgi:hypothetical protein